MLEKCHYVWRVCATGFSFMIFGLGGLLLRIMVFPLIQLVWKNSQQRTWIARRIIRMSFNGFIWLMHGLSLLTYEVQGIERLNRRGLLILSNHPSLIDVVFLMALVKRADCIVKQSLFKNIFTRGPVRAAGFVCNNSGEALLSDCLYSLHEGGNLIIFPEGTRTPRQGKIKLQRGAAHVAVRGRIDITPIRIQVTPLTLGKGEPWWHVPIRRPHFIFEVEDDIPVSDFICDSEAIATRRLNEYLTTYFFA